MSAKKGLTQGQGGGEDTEAANKPIPPEVARHMCEWRFWSGDEATPEALAALPKPITYLLTASGTRVVRKTPVGVVVEDLATVGEPLIPLPLKPLETGLVLQTPKVPWEVLRTIVAFFREVAKTKKTEALVRVYLHKQTREWVLKVPAQEVGAASVDVDDNWKFDDEGAYVHVMDVHSHVEMSAFFSGTDDADEKRAVRLYGVIGKVSDPQPHSSWRMWTGFNFLPLKLTDVIEVPPLRFNAPVQRTVAELLMGDEQAKTVSVDLSKLDPFIGAEFPKEWMEALTEHTWRWQGSHGWDDEWDAAYWQQGSSRWGQSSLVFPPSHASRGDAFQTPPLGGRLAMIQQAKDFARVHTTKLVYMINGTRISRVKANGEVYPVSMTAKAFEAMQKRQKDRGVMVFDITPPACKGD